MCVVSMVTDHYFEKWHPLQPPEPCLPTPFQIYPFVPQIPSQAEIDEFRRLLERAREYDRRNNEPNCELQEKKDRLKALAKDLGFNIDFIDEKETP